ncbi:MAG TPA: ATP-dependent sacrificial sulfur transferase LarE [Spirochaetota bacterium]
MGQDQKLSTLSDILKEIENAAIGFSGGVDSTFLAKVCHDVLGDKVVAITLVSPMNPQSEIDNAKKLAEQIGIRHVLVVDDDIEEDVAANTVDRCYHCKKIEFTRMIGKAKELGFSVILDGSNSDDLNDYRPGKKALDELGVRSPLREAGLTKDEIRSLSHYLDLPTWDKPALACLASRVPYGEKITKDILHRIEKAEEYLRSLGFRQFRVRSHSNIARIEVDPDEITIFFDKKMMTDIAVKMKSFGYSYVTLDLEGYKTGSMNREIEKKDDFVSRE